MSLRVAFVGTGPNPKDPGPDGYAMAYRHAAGYYQIDDCEMVACADIVKSNAAKFAETWDIDDVYEDYETMVEAVEPDIISVCVPPRVHAEVVIGAALTGSVRAIHCEKPMATTWAACKEMVRVCDAQGVKLTFGHQRRFGKPFREAKRLLDAGEIGALERIEFAEENLFDAGTHLFDLAGYFTDQTPVEWVLANVDYREENIKFGAHNANQALSQWRYENGVYGLASTGHASDFVGSYLRLIGTDGIIEIGVHDGPTLRISLESGTWEELDTDGETIHGPPGRSFVGSMLNKVKASVGSGNEFVNPSYVQRAIEDVVRAVREDEVSELNGENALQATELIFASWESARTHGRVDLPLDIEDNPLESMLENGEFPVAPAR